MELRRAVEAFAALAQEHRLAVFRLMISEGAGGLTAGEIAHRLAIPPSTLSHHLAHLERAGLLRSRRVDRRIFYAVDVKGTRALVTFLTDDCCGGHPEICGYQSRDRCRDPQDRAQDRPPASRRAVAKPAGAHPKRR
jgi:ArsR family transcriptional regulator